MSCSTPKRRLTIRQAFRESAAASDSHGYHVVKFDEDEAVCCIPAARVVGEIEAGKCCVKWTDGEIYSATVLVSGSYIEMKRAEETLSMSESNKENQPSAAKKPRTGKTGKTGKKQSNSKKPRKQTKKPSKEKQKKPRKNEIDGFELAEAPKGLTSTTNGSLPASDSHAPTTNDSLPASDSHAPTTNDSLPASDSSLSLSSLDSTSTSTVSSEIPCQNTEKHPVIVIECDNSFATLSGGGDGKPEDQVARRLQSLESTLREHVAFMREFCVRVDKCLKTKEHQQQSTPIRHSLNGLSSWFNDDHYHDQFDDFGQAQQLYDAVAECNEELAQRLQEEPLANSTHFELASQLPQQQYQLETQPPTLPLQIPQQQPLQQIPQHQPQQQIPQQQPLQQIPQQQIPQQQPLQQIAQQQIPQQQSSVVQTPPQPPQRPSVLNSDLQLKIRRASSSRKNFAANLVRELFTEEERKTSNVNGRNKKKQLDKGRISSVKTMTFRNWPLDSREDEEKEWKVCVGAIDEANRRLSRNTCK